MTLARTILHAAIWGAVCTTTAHAAGDAPPAWAITPEPPGIPFVIECPTMEPCMAPVLAAFDGARPMGPFVWGNPDTYWCGVDLDCGGGDQPAPVPLPATVWLMIFATAALAAMRRRTNAR